VKDVDLPQFKGGIVQESTLRFRNAQIQVKAEITTVRGELLDMDKLTELLIPALEDSEMFIEMLKRVGGEDAYVNFTMGMIERLSPEQTTTLMEWLGGEGV
jgi:hypothetical protein